MARATLDRFVHPVARAAFSAEFRLEGKKVGCGGPEGFR
jgi:hypothetical protein